MMIGKYGSQIYVEESKQINNNVESIRLNDSNSNCDENSRRLEVFDDPKDFNCNHSLKQFNSKRSEEIKDFYSEYSSKQNCIEIPENKGFSKQNSMKSNKVNSTKLPAVNQSNLKTNGSEFKIISKTYSDRGLKYSENSLKRQNIKRSFTNQERSDGVIIKQSNLTINSSEGEIEETKNIKSLGNKLIYLFYIEYRAFKILLFLINTLKYFVNLHPM